jgi:hypothetical protein
VFWNIWAKLMISNQNIWNISIFFEARPKSYATPCARAILAKTPATYR